MVAPSAFRTRLALDPSSYLVAQYLTTLNHEAVLKETAGEARHELDMQLLHLA